MGWALGVRPSPTALLSMSAGSDRGMNGAAGPAPTLQPGPTRRCRSRARAGPPTIALGRPQTRRRPLLSQIGRSPALPKLAEQPFPLDLVAAASPRPARSHSSKSSDDDITNAKPPAAVAGNQI